MKINYAQKFYDFVNEYRPTYEVLGSYVNNSTKILIRHKTCGYEWEVRPNYFKDRLGGCPKCQGKLKLTTQDFKAWVYTNRPEYEVLGEYVNTDTKILIKHTACGTQYTVTPHDFKSKYSSCPKCSNGKQYSQIAIKWLDLIADVHNVSIRHAENGGEIKLPITGNKVDGFCIETNTIYEFHGTAYHGGYDYYKATIISAIPSKSPEELFEETKLKMDKFISLGYKVFYVFESDYKLGLLGDYY